MTIKSLHKNFKYKKLAVGVNNQVLYYSLIGRNNGNDNEDSNSEKNNYIQHVNTLFLT